MLLRLRPPLGVTRQPVVDLDAGGARAPAGAPRSPRRAPRARAVAPPTVVARSSSSSCTSARDVEQRLRLGRFGLERGDAHLERGDRLDVGRALEVQRVLLCGDGGELDLALRTLGLDPRSGLLGGVELVHHTPLALGSRGFVGEASIERVPATCSTSRAASRVVVASAARRCARRRARRALPRGCRHRGATNRAHQSDRPPGDDRQRRLAQHEVESVRPVTVGQERAVEHPLDRRRESGPRAADALGEPPGPGALGTGCAARRPAHRPPRAVHRCHRRPVVRAPDGRGRTVDHDGPERVAEHRLHCTLRTGVDLEVVDQWPDHAGHRVERRSRRRVCAPRRVPPRGLRRGPATGRGRRRRRARRRRRLRALGRARVTAPLAVTAADRTAGSDATMRSCVATRSPCSTGEGSTRAPLLARERHAG